jgi:alpha-beta hydrolase superfamily lysophospholipase
MDADREISQQPLAVLCDGSRLAGGACIPAEPLGTVVLMHGVPSVTPPDPDDTGYPGFARAFAAKGWAAVWADMRAVRKSPGYFSIEGWVRDVRAIVDAARALPGAASGPTAVVGSSAGGAVAVEAVARGAPVDALALLGTPAAWVSFAGAPAEGLVRITQEAGMAVDPRVVADPTTWADEFDRVTPERSITAVRVPVLVVHGTADDVVPVDHARRIAEASGRAEVRILEGAGHQLRREPGIVDLLDEWLRRRLP